MSWGVMIAKSPSLFPKAYWPSSWYLLNLLPLNSWSETNWWRVLHSKQHITSAFFEAIQGSRMHWNLPMPYLLLTTSVKVLKYLSHAWLQMCFNTWIQSCALSARTCWALPDCSLFAAMKKHQKDQKNWKESESYYSEIIQERDSTTIPAGHLQMDSCELE